MATNQNKKAEPLDWTNTDGFNAKNFNAFGDYSNQMFDMNHLREIANKNIKAIADMNQVILQGVQAIASRTNQIVQQNAQNSMECMKEALSCNSLNDVQHKQKSLYNDVVQNLTNNAKEVTEISSKVAMEVLDVYNKRVSESKDELHATCKTSNCK